MSCVSAADPDRTAQPRPSGKNGVVVAPPVARPSRQARTHGL